MSLIRNNIKILFFLIFISFAASIKIGYIAPNTGGVSYQILNAFAEKLSENMSSEFIITDLGLNSATFVQDLADPTMTVAIANCAEDIDEQLEGYIAGNGTVLWCYDLFTDDGCPKDKIPGLSVITPIEICIFIFRILFK